MSTTFVDPRYLSAHSIATYHKDTAGDPLRPWYDVELPPGEHVRLAPASAIGLPLAPWVLLRIPADEVGSGSMVEYFSWTDRAGRPVNVAADGRFHLEDIGGEIYGRLRLPGKRFLAIEADFAPGPQARGSVAVIDAMHRTLARRSAYPFIAAGPSVTAVKIAGRDPVVLRGWALNEGRALEAIFGAEPSHVERLSGPAITGARWYAASTSAQDAADRASHFGPLRRTPAEDIGDAPAPWPSAPVAIEAARIARLRTELDPQLQAMWADITTPPGDAVAVHRDGGRSIREPIERSVLLKSMDPGVARYLGLAGTFKGEPDAWPASRSIWIAGALFACAGDAALPLPDLGEQRVLAKLRDLSAGAGDILALVNAVGIEPRAFVTAAFVAPPSDPPTLDGVEPGRSNWIRGDDGGPGNAFRQQYRVPNAPFAALVAVGRKKSGQWMSLHRPLTPDRNETQILGSTHTLQNGRFATIDVAPIEGDLVDDGLRIAVSDVFGRYGRPFDVTLVEPPRPLPPVPSLDCTIRPRQGYFAPSDPLGSPGHMVLTIDVPAYPSLAAGALALSTVVLRCSWGVVIPPIPVTPAGGTFSREVALPLPTEPYAASEAGAEAQLQDVAGRSAAPAARNVSVRDPRLPDVPRTAAGLLWTSRPGAAEEVELRLSFPAPDNAIYRVYITDERALGVREAVSDGAALSRAAVADLGVRSADASVSAHRTDRSRFRLLAEHGIGASGGLLRYTLALPRSLETVQFLRFVPVTEAGLESAFADVPLVAVAVPSDRAPPAPRLEITQASGDAAVHVAIIAEGIDHAALARLGGGPIDYRVRRTAGPVASASYAREIQGGHLAPKNGRFEADFTDVTADTYVRYTYWAEIRMPAEKRLEGEQEVFPMGVVTPSTQPQRSAAKGVYSQPSAAATVVVRPAAAPRVDAVQVEAVLVATQPARKVKVRLTGVPTPSRLAIGSFAMEIFRQPAGGDLQHLATSFPVAFGVAEAEVDDCARVGIVLIDPLGNRSSVAFADVSET